MKQSFQIARVRRGFTLLELLVVVGIMGMLATVAISGYNAAVQGMTVRGVRSNVASLVQAAQQRAAIDHVRTAVFFYNELLRAGDQDRSDVVVGQAVAVRATGRISLVGNSTSVAREGASNSSKFLFDEFSDLERTYAVVSNGMDNATLVTSGKGAIRLFRFDPGASKLTYSFVHDYVIERLRRAGSLIGHRETLLTTGSETNLYGYAFGIDRSRSGSADSQWRAGDSYGVEIAVLQLPHGFVFGTAIPSSMASPVSDNPVNAIFFAADGTPSGATSVRISAVKNVGSAAGKVSVVSTFTSDEIETN